MVSNPPKTKMYQLIRLILGNATSRAPSISGRQKLPSVTGMDGTRKNQTMITPCQVNSRLYTSGETMAPLGVSS